MATKPLNKAQMYILAMLWGYGPRHGYGIRQLINGLDSDRYRISLAGTYENILVLHKCAYITWHRKPEVDNKNRTVYTLTERGKRALLDQFNEYQLLMRIAAHEDS